MFRSSTDSAERYVPSEPKEAIPHLSFAPLWNAADRFPEASGRLDPRGPAIGQLSTVNGQRLRVREGIEQRAWEEVEEMVGRVAGAVERVAESLRH